VSTSQSGEENGAIARGIRAQLVYLQGWASDSTLGESGNGTRDAILCDLRTRSGTILVATDKDVSLLRRVTARMRRAALDYRTYIDPSAADPKEVNLCFAISSVTSDFLRDAMLSRSLKRW